MQQLTSPSVHSALSASTNMLKQNILQRQKASDSNEEKEYRKTNGTEQTERKEKKEQKQEAEKAISACIAADGGCWYSATLRRAIAVFALLTLYAKKREETRTS